MQYIYSKKTYSIWNSPPVENHLRSYETIMPAFNAQKWSRQYRPDGCKGQSLNNHLKDPGGLQAMS